MKSHPAYYDAKQNKKDDPHNPKRFSRFFFSYADCSVKYHSNPF
ncbi:hypothetical protein HPHPA17_0950 [Helicobacter pylori Hp A-17]|nr:hypothetical protein HPHPA17_0950 [Helicobacter pylori Hp A-17]